MNNLYLTLVGVAILYTQNSICNDISTRVVGGTPARTGQFPHHAYVKSLDERNRVISICSGTLIGLKWVLTIASCVQSGHLIEVGLGSNNFESPALVLKTKHMHIHPNFTAKHDLRYDIAVLEFHPNIKFTKNIKPILLNKVQCSHCKKSTILVSGFGQSANQSLDVLQYARVKLISAKKCQQYFPAPLICTTGYKIRERCPFKNDAGSALIVYVPPPNRMYLLIGLFAAMTDQGCVHGDPVGYLDTSLFLDWIISLI